MPAEKQFCYGCNEWFEAPGEDPDGASEDRFFWSVSGLPEGAYAVTWPAARFFRTHAGEGITAGTASRDREPVGAATWRRPAALNGFVRFPSVFRV